MLGQGGKVDFAAFFCCQILVYLLKKISYTGWLNME